MSELLNKDELTQLLRNGDIEKFNKLRPYDEIKFPDFTEIDLSNVKICGVNLSNVDLSGSDLSKSEIESVNFNNSDLSAVNFTRTTITESNFAETIMEGSLLNNANIISGDFMEVDFNGINISGADLTGADLTLSINLMMSVYDADTIWPESDMLPDDFEPQDDMSFADLEDSEEFLEEQF
ncbi:MAG TPA: pentapeptide repeat-containing protein [Candidatus Gastranaerophilales bacterium]|nr:pentapeptide repeat-containing protein [Candidatus Gastranaerophilales bacterium]